MLVLALHGCEECPAEELKSGAGSLDSGIMTLTTHLNRTNIIWVEVPLDSHGQAYVFFNTAKDLSTVTNIFIGGDYAGSIQTGTNFYTVKDLNSIPKGNFSLWNPPGICPQVSATNDIGVKWLECPITLHCMNVTTNAMGEATSWSANSILHYSVEPTIRLGLKLDGTVVWRNATP